MPDLPKERAQPWLSGSTARLKMLFLQGWALALAQAQGQPRPAAPLKDQPVPPAPYQGDGNEDLGAERMFRTLQARQQARAKTEPSICTGVMKFPPKSNLCTFDGDPVVCTPVAAWIFRDGAWVTDDEVWRDARVWPVDRWLAKFGSLPPLPQAAFRFGDPPAGT